MMLTLDASNRKRKTSRTLTSVALGSAGFGHASRLTAWNTFSLLTKKYISHVET